MLMNENRCEMNNAWIKKRLEKDDRNKWIGYSRSRFLCALELSKNEKKLMFSVYSSIMTKPNKRYR